MLVLSILCSQPTYQDDISSLTIEKVNSESLYYYVLLETSPSTSFISLSPLRVATLPPKITVINNKGMFQVKYFTEPETSD